MATTLMSTSFMATTLMTTAVMATTLMAADATLVIYLLASN